MTMKKKKDLSPEQIMKKKFKRYSRKLMYVLLVVAVYFLFLPKIVPSTAPQVEQTKTTVLAVYSDISSQASKILGSATKAVDELGINKEEFTNKSPEVFIEQKVDEIKAKLGSLPQEQAVKIKKQFCADLIEDAINECKLPSKE